MSVEETLFDSTLASLKPCIHTFTITFAHYRRLPYFDALDVDQVVDLIVELFEVSTQEAKDETFQTRGAYVWLAWL